MMQNKAVFLDRDGTINVDTGYVYKKEDLQLLPGVLDALHIFQNAGYLLIIVTNQSGVGRGFYTLDDVNRFNESLSLLLRENDILLSDFYVCPHSPEDNCKCRKPSPYLLNKAMEEYDVDAQASFMFGDKDSDLKAGQNAGIPSYLVTAEHSLLYWAQSLII